LIALQFTSIWKFVPATQDPRRSIKNEDNELGTNNIPKILNMRQMESQMPGYLEDYYIKAYGNGGRVPKSKLVDKPIDIKGESIFFLF
jgi:hypothetical protein